MRLRVDLTCQYVSHMCRQPSAANVASCCLISCLPPLLSISWDGLLTSGHLELERGHQTEHPSAGLLSWSCCVSIVFFVLFVVNFCLFLLFLRVGCFVFFFFVFFCFFFRCLGRVEEYHEGHAYIRVSCTMGLGKIEGSRDGHAPIYALSYRFYWRSLFLVFMPKISKAASFIWCIPFYFLFSLIVCCLHMS